MIRTPTFILVLLLFAAGCGGEETKPLRETYAVRGQLLGATEDGRAVVIDHEAIPGYMDAMTMTFPLEDKRLLEGLAQGDKIRFDLTVGGATVQIDNVEQLSDTTRLALRSAGPADTSAAPDTLSLPPGQR